MVERGRSPHGGKYEIRTENEKILAEEINQLKEQLDREKKEQLNEIEMLKNELEKEKNKGFFARLFSK